MLWPWIGFTLFILLMLVVDLGLFQRRPHVVSLKESLVWFAVWVGLALVFNIGVVVFHARGVEAGLEFFTGFLVEKSLSVDNVFVFLLIFSYFHVPPAYHHKVLFWGILGAILLRLTFIVGGLALMEHFHGTIYFFGAFLLFTGIGMLRRKEVRFDPEKHLALRAFRRLFPVTDRYEGNRFFTRQAGRLMATPLFVVLVAIESSDIVFAVDSIPAIFAITPDAFIIYTSNVFAMLGLRALYFAVAGLMQMFHFLHYGFASIIMILGVKMLVSDVYKVPIQASLALVVFILLVCVIISLLRPRKADLKSLFERTERLGLIPFRRLLLIENILDLADLRVANAMCDRRNVRTIKLDAPWEETLNIIRRARHSRYPVIDAGNSRPIGIVHVKDLLLAETSAPQTANRLKAVLRPCLELPEDMPLDEALARFQQRFDQMAIVLDSQRQWKGIITVEDVLEDIVGRIQDEFDESRSEPLVSLADALTPARVVLDLRAGSMREAIRNIIGSVPRDELPADLESIAAAVLEREQSSATYLGRGLAVPRARLRGIDKPLLIFARSAEGVPLDSTAECAELFFLVLTPSSMRRVQPRLLADIVGLLESEYVTERLHTAQTPQELIEAIRAGQEVSTDWGRSASHTWHCRQRRGGGGAPQVE